MTNRFPKLTAFLISLTWLLTISRPAAAATDFEAYFSAQTRQVIYVNWGQFRSSPLFNKLLAAPLNAALAGESPYKTFLEMFGIDLMKDVDYVAIGAPIWAKPGEGEGTVVIGGTFKAEKVRAGMEKLVAEQKDRAEIIQDGQSTLYKFAPEGMAGVKHLYVSQMDAKHVVIGITAEQLKQARERAAQKGPSAVKGKGITEALAGITKDTSLFLFMDGSELANMASNDPKMAKLFQNAESLAVSVDVSTGVVLRGTLSMNDADAAKELQSSVTELIDQLKMFVNAILLQEPNMKPLAEVTKTLRVSSKDKAILIEGEATGDAIDAIIKAKELEKKGN
jgi:hypothetical protein